MDIGDSYAIFDLETSGLNSSADDIIEFGWCVVRGGIPDVIESRLIYRNTPLSDDIVRITGITDDLLNREGEELSSVIRDFMEDTYGLPLVGHNITRFDVFFVERACRTCNLTPPARSRYIDTAALYKGRALGIHYTPNPSDPLAHWIYANDVLSRRVYGLKYNLAECAKTLNISTAGIVPHRAAGDVMLTQRIFEVLTYQS